MNTRHKLAAAVMAIGLAFGATATAQEQQPSPGTDDPRAGRMARHHGMRGNFGKGGMFRLFGAALNLTDAQKQFARQLMADTRKQAEPIRAQLRQNRTDLQNAIKQNNQTAITQIGERNGVLLGQLSALHGKAMASFYQQLTPEQRAKAEELQAKFKERAQNRAKRQNRQQQ
jgi:Spy/CpxP family protein refolding chaperone